MRVCCKRLGAPFTCKRGSLAQLLRFQRIAAEDLKGVPSAPTLAGLAILTKGF
jgi:hypothetical protein